MAEDVITRECRRVSVDEVNKGFDAALAAREYALDGRISHDDGVVAVGKDVFQTFYHFTCVRDWVLASMSASSTV